MYEDDEICAVIEGYPVLSEPRLDGLAKQEGVARALVEGYKQRGTDILNFLRGDFCFALLHKREQKAFLAVDRLGIRPLTYTLNNRYLVFASSAEAIRRHPGVSTSVDPQALFNYMYFHVVPGPGCAYLGLKRLLPGSFAIYSKGELTTETYWENDYHEDTDTSFENLKGELIDLLDRSIRQHVPGGNLGCFLSGGTDSSTIAGILTRITGKPARTYSIGFRATGYDEIEYARATARHFGTEHHEYYVTPDDVIDAVPRIAQVYDNPFGNASAVPTYYCARLAKEDGVDRLLGGDGGDELFGGNTRYARQWLFSLYSDLPPLLRTGLIEPLISKFPGGSKVWLIRKLRRYVEQASVPMPERLQTYNLLTWFGIDNIFCPEFLEDIDSRQPVITMTQLYENVRAESLLNRMLGLDLKITLADNDLPKVTKMCELAGVEVAFPLLDDDLIAFSAKLPVNSKVKRTHLRYFFKQALRDFLPRETLAKPKHGFGLPFGPWFQTNVRLREMALDNLHDLTLRHIIQPQFITELVDNRLSTHPPYYGTMIWILMMLEQWFKEHIEGKRKAKSAGS
jgi:asparagine synthase (glutamine-hydrolysing)